MATYSLDQLLDIAQRRRNWSRWGDADEVGTLNLVDPDAIVRAAGLVRKGKVFSCSLPFGPAGPQTPGGGSFRFNPIHQMLATGTDAKAGAQDHVPGLRFADDTIFMPLQCATQWDALSHVFYDGQMYNGRPMELVSSNGAAANAIDKVADKTVGRGVLLDAPRHLERPWLEPGEGIGADLLEACAQRQGVDVGRGDFVLVRTGHLALVRNQGSWGTYAGGDAPGINLSGAEWLCDREVAAIATDTWGMEVRPNEVAEVFQPLHVVLLVNAGMTIGEMFDLEPLADDSADDGVYEFLFVAPPLPFQRAVGSPVNPIAIK